MGAQAVIYAIEDPKTSLENLKRVFSVLPNGAAVPLSVLLLDTPAKFTTEVNYFPSLL